MGTTRTAWHVILQTLLNQRAPPRFEVRGEVQLSSEPLRADYLLLRKVKPEDGEARTLRKLWGFLPNDTISSSRAPDGRTAPATSTGSGRTCTCITPTSRRGWSSGAISAERSSSPGAPRRSTPTSTRSASPGTIGAPATGR